MTKSDRSGEDALITFGTVAALVSAGAETSWLLVASGAGVGLLCALATLPWHEQLAGRGKVKFFCAWAWLWPFLLIYFAWDGLRKYADHWGDYRARRRYERNVPHPREDWKDGPC